MNIHCATMNILFLLTPMMQWPIAKIPYVKAQDQLDISLKLQILVGDVHVKSLRL